MNPYEVYVGPSFSSGLSDVSGCNGRLAYDTS